MALSSLSAQSGQTQDIQDARYGTRIPPHTTGSRGEGGRTEGETGHRWSQGKTGASTS